MEGRNSHSPRHKCRAATRVQVSNIRTVKIIYFKDGKQTNASGFLINPCNSSYLYIKLPWLLHLPAGTYTLCCEATITFTKNTGSYRFPNHQGLCTSCPRKYHTTCLIHISLNGIHSTAYLAEQGKDYSYLITCRLQAISCKDLTSKKLLTALVSRKPEGETVKEDKQSLKYQGLQEACLKSHYLCESKYFTRLTWARASPKKCMVKA